MGCQTSLATHRCVCVGGGGDNLRTLEVKRFLKAIRRKRGLPSVARSPDDAPPLARRRLTVDDPSQLSGVANRDCLKMASVGGGGDTKHNIGSPTMAGSQASLVECAVCIPEIASPEVNRFTGQCDQNDVISV